MSTFEEQFPSLKDLINYDYRTEEYGDWCPVCKDDSILLTKEHRISVEILDIEKNCLDKQKVREAIEKYRDIIYFAEGSDYCYNALLKELGLEDKNE